eukprot:gene25880-11552_t
MMLKSSMSVKAVRVTTSMKPTARAVVVRADKNPEGFVEEDSAGQTNMFPTVMKPSFSSSDDNSGNVLYIGGGAAVIAAVAIGGSLLVGTPGIPVPVAEGDYETLSFYSAKFSGEGFTAVAAPAVAAE